MRRQLLLALTISLAACRLGRSDEQSDRPLPAPEPSSKTPPSRPAEAPAPAPNRPRESDDVPNRPTGAPATTGKANSEPAGSAPTATGSAAPTPSAAPAPTLTLPAVDGGLSVPTAACIQKCQARLQACISKPMPLDAGLPSLESMAECKKAFEDCRTDCQ
jgi:hypothetical protein